MTVLRLFSTEIAVVALRARSSDLNRRLFDECQALRASDEAGQRWSQTGYVGGYTSYGSLSKLHRISSVFAELERAALPHVRAYAAGLEYDLRRRRIETVDCWVNAMPAGVAHGAHLHPLSFVSGVYYVAAPRGSAPLKLEDPRLDRLMAAPPRRHDAARGRRAHVAVAARAGRLVLFESWLRHEVPASAADGERISVSFNWAWRER